MVPPSVGPYLLTRAALTWATDMLGPEAGATDATAIAFPNDMSRAKYPTAHDSWLPPSAPDAAVNWLTWALVHWPGAAPWATPAALPPPHAATVTAATAAASGPARKCLRCALMNSMTFPFSPSRPRSGRIRSFLNCCSAVMGANSEPGAAGTA